MSYKLFLVPQLFPQLKHWHIFTIRPKEIVKRKENQTQHKSHDLGIFKVLSKSWTCKYIIPLRTLYMLYKIQFSLTMLLIQLIKMPLYLWNRIAFLVNLYATIKQNKVITMIIGVWPFFWKLKTVKNWRGKNYGLLFFYSTHKGTSGAPTWENSHYGGLKRSPFLLKMKMTTYGVKEFSRLPILYETIHSCIHVNNVIFSTDNFGRFCGNDGTDLIIMSVQINMRKSNLWRIFCLPYSIKGSQCYLYFYTHSYNVKINCYLYRWKVEVEENFAKECCTVTSLSWQRTS